MILAQIKLSEVMAALDTLLAIPATSQMDFAGAMLTLCVADDFVLRRAQKQIEKQTLRTGDELTRTLRWVGSYRIRCPSFGPTYCGATLRRKQDSLRKRGH